MPAVGAAAEQLAGRPACASIDPELCVALGAAVHAGVLSGDIQGRTRAHGRPVFCRLARASIWFCIEEWSVIVWSAGPAGPQGCDQRALLGTVMTVRTMPASQAKDGSTATHARQSHLGSSFITGCTG